MLWCVETGGVQMRAYRLALDPTAGQVDALHSHAGAAWWAFNHAPASPAGLVNLRSELDQEGS